VQTVFHPDKVGVYNISYVTPFVSADIDKITNVVNGLVAQYPAMTDVWKKYNQHILTSLAGVDNYQIILRDPITGPEDLKGRKICGAGLNLRYVEGSGVVGVPSPLSDWYNNIRTGICDGTIVWPEAIQNFKLSEVAPYLVDISFGGVNSMALTVNERKWKSYPPEVQAAFAEAAETYRHALASYAMQRSAESVQAFQDEGGTLIPVSDDDRKNWAEGLPPIAEQWVSDQEARGIPAKNILNSYLEGMSALGATPLRDWSE
jgi:TRAP-type C4-dicarboxylate transport system substrate-binding protein